MDFNKITDFLDSLIPRGIPSVDCIIYKDHKPLYRYMTGTTDAEKTQEIKGNELYLMFSMTKVQTMTAVMQLVEREMLSLEDEVSKLKKLNDAQLQLSKKLKNLNNQIKGIENEIKSLPKSVNNLIDYESLTNGIVPWDNEMIALSGMNQIPEL